MENFLTEIKSEKEIFEEYDDIERNEIKLRVQV